MLLNNARTSTIRNIGKQKEVHGDKNGADIYPEQRGKTNGTKLAQTQIQNTEASSRQNRVSILLEIQSCRQRFARDKIMETSTSRNHSKN